MLLQVFLGVLLLLKGVQCNIIKPISSHQQLNFDEQIPHEYARQTRIINEHHQPHQNIYQSASESNTIALPSEQPIQPYPSTSSLKIMRQKKQMEVQNFIDKSVDQSQQIQNRGMKSLFNSHNFEKNADIGEDIKYQNFESFDRINQRVSNIKNNDEDNIKKYNLEADSQFVDHQEKTLYLKFIEAINKIVKALSESSHNIFSEQNSTNIISNSTSPTHNSLELTKSLQIQQVSNISSAVEPLKVQKSLAAKAFQAQKDINLTSKGQGLARRRKKLNFIFFALSFGGACIFLIKILDERGHKRKHEGRVIHKIPTEDFYIQQI